MRKARGSLALVRSELAGADAGEPPVTRLERFRWRTVFSAVALTVIAFLFIGQFSKVNLLGALRHMEAGWFLVALLGSALTYFAAAANLAAFVPKRLFTSSRLLRATLDRLRGGRDATNGGTRRGELPLPHSPEC